MVLWLAFRRPNESRMTKTWLRIMKTIVETQVEDTWGQKIVHQGFTHLQISRHQHLFLFVLWYNCAFLLFSFVQFWLFSFYVVYASYSFWTSSGFLKRQSITRILILWCLLVFGYPTGELACIFVNNSVIVIEVQAPCLLTKKNCKEDKDKDKYWY